MADTAGAKTASRAGPVRVVVADDADDIRLLMRVALEQRGDIEVVAEAADGYSAIEAVRSTGADALLLDIDMPGVDGLGVIDELHVHDGGDDVRIVVYTAAINTELREQVMARGADAYLHKGADLDQVAAALEGGRPRAAAAPSSAVHEPSLRRPAGIVGNGLVVAALAVVVSQLGIGDVPAVVVLACCVCAAFVVPVDVVHGSDRRGTMHVDAHLNVAALMLLPPATVIAALVGGYVGALAIRRRPARGVMRGGRRQLVAVATGTAAATALRGVGAPSVVAAVAGSAVIVIAGFALFALEVRRDGGHFAARRTATLCTVVWAGAAPIGVATGLLAERSYHLIPLMAVPWALVLLASGLFVRTRLERELLDELLTTATVAQQATSAPEVEDVLTAAASRLLGGARVRMTSKPSAIEGWTSMPMQVGDDVRWLSAETRGGRRRAVAVLQPLTTIGQAMLAAASRVDAHVRFATTDALTGLANSRAVEAALVRITAQAQRVGGTAAAIYVDLDGFKAVNDSFGHKAGNEVLCEFADRLRQTLRPYDLAARLGGDEFVVIVGAMPDPGVVDAIVERIRGACAEPFTAGGRRLWVDASIGTAVYPTTCADPSDLLHVADSAMYDDKRARKGLRRASTAEVRSDR